MASRRDSMARKETSTFKLWAERTSCHGVADLIHTERRTVRVVWLLIIAFSIAVMGAQVVDLYNNFWSRRWETSVYEEVPKGEQARCRHPSPTNNTDAFRASTFL